MIRSNTQKNKEPMDTFNRNSIRGRAIATKEFRQPLLFPIKQIDCPRCDGTGVNQKLPPGLLTKPCSNCKGTGKV